MIRSSAAVLAALFAFSSVLTASTTYQWPNYVVDELEHLLVDNGGFNNAGVQKAITPCTNYVSGPKTAGRVTAAEWTRVLFHDFVTANVTAGTGGVDASIAFEANRLENSGLYINNSMAFFSPYVNEHVSMADLIALSLTIVTGTCSSPKLPLSLRGGRVDSLYAGPEGVPQPETDLQDTLSAFANAGFSPSDTIALTACTHTLGSVHYSENPDIVPASSVTANNTDGANFFDTSPYTLDRNLISEYLNSTGNRGGSLVTSTNITVRSDLRLFSSDNNNTVQYLAAGSWNFASLCTRVINRAMDTVPSNVTLTEVITAQVVKPVHVSVNVDSQGNVSFSGYIRLMSPWGNNSDVTISWEPRNETYPSCAYDSTDGQSSTKATYVANGTGNYGTTYYYNFSAPIDPNMGISSFTINVTNGWQTIQYSNGGYGYPVQDNVLWLPDQTSASSNSTFISGAVLTSLNPTNVSAVLAIPTLQEESLSPKITKSNFTLTKNGTHGPYTMYTGTAEVYLMNIPQTSVDIVATTALTDVAVTSRFNKLQYLGAW